MEIILASNSPRRKEILKNAGYSFQSVASCYDEKINDKEYSDILVENCAKQKALSIKNKENQNSVIISADTVVVLNNKILGKPKDKPQAIEMLKNLSDKTHFVATAIYITKGEQEFLAVEKTFVTFRKLSERDILNYIETKRPFDKAGSYGIQDEGFDFATNIEGELDNVIGFPLKLFEKLYKKII